MHSCKAHTPKEQEGLIKTSQDSLFIYLYNSEIEPRLKKKLIACVYSSLRRVESYSWIILFLKS